MLAPGSVAGNTCRLFSAAAFMMDGINIGLLFGLAVRLAWPVGRYMARGYAGERTWLHFLTPLERGCYRLARIDQLHL